MKWWRRCVDACGRRIRCSRSFPIGNPGRGPGIRGQGSGIVRVIRLRRTAHGSSWTRVSAGRAQCGHCERLRRRKRGTDLTHRPECRAPAPWSLAPGPSINRAEKGLNSQPGISPQRKVKTLRPSTAVPISPTLRALLMSTAAHSRPIFNASRHHLARCILCDYRCLRRSYTFQHRSATTAIICI